MTARDKPDPLEVRNAASLGSAISSKAFLYLAVDEFHVFAEVCARHFDASLDCVDCSPKGPRTRGWLVIGDEKASVHNLPPPSGEFTFR